MEVLASFVTISKWPTEKAEQEGWSSARSVEEQVLQDWAAIVTWTEGDCTAVAGGPVSSCDLTALHVAGDTQFSLITHLSLTENG